MLLTLLALLAVAQGTGPEVAGCPLDAKHDAAWRQACDAAIAAEKDPKARAVLLFRSAYAHNESQEYLASLPLLEEAVKLDPVNPSAWGELSYTQNALGDYAAAENSANAKLALGAADKQVLQERAFARFYRGNFDGAYADRNAVATIDPRDSKALAARAEAAMWAGRFDLAKYDISSAEVSAITQEERDNAARVSKAYALWTKRSAAADPAAACLAGAQNGYRSPDLIGDCSAAFLAEKNSVKRAQLISARATAWLVAEQDPLAAADDRAIAVALDPGNAGWHSNLGFAYLGGGRIWAASREFDRSLAIAETWLAFAGRASARYDRQDAPGAFADAKRSFELHPNELALTVLGDLAEDRGDIKSARLYWMGAWHLGDRDDGLLARLKRVGVADPAHEPAPGKIEIGS